MNFEVKSKKGTVIVGSLALVSLGIGILIGHLITPSGKQYSESLTNVEVVQINEHEDSKGDKWMKEKHINEKIIERIDPKRLKENLRYLTEKPHIAGSKRDDELANYILNKYKEAGFDSAELVPYNLLLSKPDPNNPNKVTLYEDGKMIFESQHKEKPIHKDDEDPEFVHAFNAYTPAASVSTKAGEGVVYVNYGRVEDFNKLKELGVNVSGQIALIRYGKIFRGNKVRHAEQAGAIGTILFSDPKTLAPEGIESKDVYDKTFWLPGSGIQRGTTILRKGDPLTPGWPSTEHAYRIPEEEVNFHKIPSQPIGYSDAKVILELLGGDDAPSDWQGGLPGIVYKLGPHFKPNFRNVTLTLSTHNSNKIERNYNVIGIIKGSIEPDRYVMMGNHRDAWGYGAIDPSSGTTQFLETIRVYGTLLKEGWRPRRSLVFCSWGAEEYGIIGSGEWVEEFIDKLQARTVAYINVDACASGPRLKLGASPMLWDAVFHITAMIPGVEDPSRTLFDEWKEYHEVLKSEAPEKPIINTLGSGSDFAPFTILGGIPAFNIRFEIDKVKYNISGSYPLYHTQYETFYMVSTFVDPKFKIHQGCGRLASLAIKYLSDSSVLPYSISRYPDVMMKLLKENKNRQKLMEIYDKYMELENAVERFQVMTKKFNYKIATASSFLPLELRAINDQLMKLEQSFIIPEGLPNLPYVRHAIFAPAQFDNYASSGFPGLSNLLHEYDALKKLERLERNKEIRRHISDLTIMVDRATSLLKDVHLI